MLLGYTPEELVGESPYNFIHPDDVPNVREGYIALLETPDNFQRRFRMRRIDGEYVWVEMSSKAVRDTDGTVRELVAVTRDISKRKKAEDDAARLNSELLVKAAQLEEANRELEAFTYSVSHDRHAPLRAMDGFSRILTETYRDKIPPEAVRYLDRVRANARQMGALIDDLLMLSRVGKRPLEKRFCDVRDVAHLAFQEVIEGQDTDSPKFILSHLPPCQGDPGLIKQVFVNLLSNAIKFSRGRPNPTVEVGSEDKAQGLQVYFVRDNGIGFDMEYENKIFGVFQRLHDPNQYEGTGVGLAIVSRIIYRHGGRIWVNSVPNAGTTFYFTLEGERDAQPVRRNLDG
jgi:PAS domain S-box-containing protein